MKKLKRVRIVCYEDVNAWILGKFARKINEGLNALSIKSDIAKLPNPKADINHHIIYLNYQGKKSSIDTLMITHIDSLQKLNLLKRQLKVAKLGICMSRETMQQLLRTGLGSEKLYYINPAHDGVIKPRPIVVGITSKIHPDNRKKANLLLKLAKRISPNEFMFEIMGGGWEKIVGNMQKLGFKVNYCKDFDYEKYIKLVPTFDYFLYFGFDEGSMGFVDALSAGVKTIVTPQGYHLDALGGVTYPINNLDDIIRAFDQIAEEKRRLVRSVSNWTWENYTREHIKVWECLLNNQTPKNLLDDKSNNIIKLSGAQKTIERAGINRQAGLWLKIQHIGAILFYLFKPLTFKTFLWTISPVFLKNVYRKHLLNS